ncbi:ATP-dependent helicase [Alkalicella caledoniensis]|uniref:DNA 3'-5' helicase n=1 Tax=Alkalicella caledoniensis TaxID=2731377 RepID=A0A7G9WB60_ALKCA|nr:ATP-dependent helicase [Alkalicella caledoniensis]QNO15922.1 ATP-dependent helicase [Alkalicella caledoniensis]
MFIKENWVEVDGITLEKGAKAVVRSDKNYAVMAGPGAGKTELLAQRASYLLQTHVCEYPKKILAISFKKDAAKNLKDRVNLRCGKKLGNRFESMTYDSFAKNLIDHFRNALPQEYALKKGYNILVSLSRDNIRDYLLNFEGEEPSHLKGNISVVRQIDMKEFWDRFLTRQKLPFEEPKTPNEWLREEVWMKLLKGEGGFDAGVTFPMLTLLAEFLLRSNPLIVKALNMTYSHVFLDEFQDTTELQYELLKTAFLESNVIITAVGDRKQRIMAWAGALPDAFKLFINDFNACEENLVMNHRSAPRLIEIQRAFAKKLKDSETDIIAGDKWEENDGICEIWRFQDFNLEAETITATIIQLIENEKINARDICILVKQKTEDYSKRIVEELHAKGIKARDESRLQDLLADDLVGFILDIFYVSIGRNNSKEYDRTLNTLIQLKGYDKDRDLERLITLETKLQTFCLEIKDLIKEAKTEEQFKVIIIEVINFINIDVWKAHYPQYKNKKWLSELLMSFFRQLWDEYTKNDDWLKAIKDFKGENTVAIMTIHKSKGLEYDTIFFVGLEDAAFWNIKNQEEEETCTFFVALSRAKTRIFITYSGYREVGRNFNQRTDNVIGFYNTLEESGLVKICDY